MKNEFKMSLFAAPISPVKDSLTGRVSRPATVYPSREVTLQEVARLITGDPALERLTRQLRLPLETGDKERFSELKRQTLPYVTPCGTFSYRKSDRLLAPSGLVVVDVLAFWGLWYVIFKDWDDFVESVRNLLTPDIVSIFRDVSVDVAWSELKGGVWLLLCLSLVASEYWVFFR